MNELNRTTIFVVVLFILIELDKIMYKKLDEDYKKFTLKDKYDDQLRYYNSNRVNQFVKNIENHTSGRGINIKVIGFIALLLFIYLYNNVDINYSTMLLKVVGIIIISVISILAVYGLVRNIKELNEFKKEYNKQNVNLEILYIILRSFYLLISVMASYIYYK